MEKVMNAIILSAGFGSRCVPITYTVPKGLMKVRGEVLIERAICQLHEKGITDITVVVGYKKEMFGYLTGKYGVKLVYNPEYTYKNTLSSLHCVLDIIGSTYILVADNWADGNMFNQYEGRGWVSCDYAKGATNEWCVKSDGSGRVTAIEIGGADSFIMVGPAYFTPSFSKLFKPILIDCYNRNNTGGYYWEDALKENLGSLPIYVNDQSGNVFDLDGLDDLRKFDKDFASEANDPILNVISKVLDVPVNKIHGTEPIKMGLTNDSFRFSVGNSNYMFRVCGIGTEVYIDRAAEHAVYQAISHLKISDDVIYINPETGHKISAYLENSRICNPHDTEDVKRCMEVLRAFHGKKLKVAHTFDLFERIAYYEKLAYQGGQSPYFNDYETTKSQIHEMKPFIDSCEKEWILSHIDPAHVNFLFTRGEDLPRLIDWEYSGMQDAHLDIAMFVLQTPLSGRPYNLEDVDALIGEYFDGNVPRDISVKIYAYVAAGGLLWFNWCEYQRALGVDHGGYAELQYRYAKEYYKIWKGQSV
jgi:CTP:phosphocholine cytidylyltransferase-like protein/thiamine kinase-like enzyme